MRFRGLLEMLGDDAEALEKAIVFNTLYVMIVVCGGLDCKFASCRIHFSFGIVHSYCTSRNCSSTTLHIVALGVALLNSPGKQSKFYMYAYLYAHVCTYAIHTCACVCNTCIYVHAYVCVVHVEYLRHMHCEVN